MITKTFAENFAKEWIRVWNAHDMDGILVLYTDDFTIESPKAAEAFPQSRGLISGKENIRRYWQAAIESPPGPAFRLLGVYTGINGITICHLNTVTSKAAIEVMKLNSKGKVDKVWVFHNI